MITAELETASVTRKLSILANIDRTILPEIMESVAENLYERVQFYPPKLPNQRYVRTDTYRRSVYKDSMPISNGYRAEAGSTGAVQNGRRYDAYLKDSRHQAAIHSGRWTTMDDDAQATVQELEILLRRELEKATND
jgi:hypothetical protein